MISTDIAMEMTNKKENVIYVTRRAIFLKVLEKEKMKHFFWNGKSVTLHFGRRAHTQGASSHVLKFPPEKFNYSVLLHLVEGNPSFSVIICLCAHLVLPRLGLNILQITMPL